MNVFEYYNNTLCIQAGWLYGQGEIITKNNYRNLLRRNWLNVLRRGCKGTPALVEFDTIPTRFKSKIIDKLGDPTKTVQHYKFKDYLINDLKAVKFFADYTLDNGEPLPQKNISEYVANSIVLNAIYEITSDPRRSKKTFNSKVGLWDKIIEVVEDLPKHTYPHSLPSNKRRLKEKLRNYKKNGYESLIHKGFCNKNSEKINDDAKRWLLSRWADRVNRVATTKQLFNEYNTRAEGEGWKKLKEEATIYNYLHQEEIIHLWHGYRYGELKSKEKFAFQFSTKLPSMRDSLWYSDGTKLNYYFLDDNGKIATCQVYEVMDAFSEVLLGFHISPTEDYEAQFFAFRMAAKVSGQRPYQLGFDNQGGHKKLNSGNMLSKLSRLSIKTQPYNGKSKTIESAFGRFQQQFLKQDWFFTGQNITAKSDESKANMEYIMANKHNLPSLADVKETYIKRRQEWNSAILHSTKKPRIDSYLNSHNPETSKIELWDMIDLFWIQRPKPIQLSAYGLSFTEKGSKYTYMKYDENNLPDVKWLRENIDKKFVVKFDTEDMALIQLYEETPLGLRHETTLTTKIEIHRGKQEQEEWEAGFIKQVLDANKAERVASVEAMEEIMEEFGVTDADYGMNAPSIKGITSKRKKKQKVVKETFGQYQKDLSNGVEIDEDDINIYKMM